MIDIQIEHLMTMAQAARLRPAGRRGRPTHPSTIARWITHGVRGHRLEAIRFGGAMYTTVEALQRFAERLSAGIGPAPPPATNHHSAESAAAELTRLGL